MIKSDRRARMMLGCAMDGGDLAVADLVQNLDAEGALGAWPAGPVAEGREPHTRLDVEAHDRRGRRDEIHVRCLLHEAVCQEPVTAALRVPRRCRRRAQPSRRAASMLRRCSSKIGGSWHARPQTVLSEVLERRCSTSECRWRRRESFEISRPESTVGSADRLGLDSGYLSRLCGPAAQRA
jgi:hypothetical protein